MRSLTIEARSRDSADALYDALSEFHPELLGSADEGYMVRVELGNFDRNVIAVLDVIERHVTDRKDSARVELDGRSYTVHAK